MAIKDSQHSQFSTVLVQYFYAIYCRQLTNVTNIFKSAKMFKFKHKIQNMFTSLVVVSSSNGSAWLKGHMCSRSY